MCRRQFLIKMPETTSTPEDQSSKKTQDTLKLDTKPENPPTELSNAEKKKQQKAEKQARRAKEKGDTPQPEDSVQKTGRDSTKPPDSTNPETSKPGKPNQQDHTKLPVRQRRQSHGGLKDPQSVPERPAQSPAPKPHRSKQVSCFAHLYAQQPRRNTLEESSKDVHPAVQELALRIGNYAICGSHARCVAMLKAFKSVRASPSLRNHITT